MKADLKELYSDFDNQNKINLDNLKIIMRDNMNTDYGKKYDFASIYKSNDDNIIEEFQHKVPLSDYEDYRSAGSCCVYDKYFTVRTSGTTGQSKKFLLTKEALTRYSSYIFLEPFYLSGVKKEKLLHTSLFRKTGNETILSDAHYRFMKENGLIDCNNFLGGEECMFSDEKANVPYLKLWIALSNEDLSAFLSTFLYDLLLLMSYLEKNWRQILEDMEQEHFSEIVPDSMKETLLTMKASSERIAFLRDEFSKGFDRPIMERIWKELKIVSGVGGHLFTAYDNALKRYTGSIPIDYYAYAQSECMSAIATDLECSEYTLMPRSAFFEFLDIDNNTVYSSKHVVSGKRYQLIITTFSGLYRYKTGDIVEIKGFTGQSPRFQICDRMKHLLNIDGEKIDEATIGLVVERLINKLKMNLRTYYVGIDCQSIPSRYVLVLDIQKTETYLEPSFIAKEFDNILQDISWDYMDLRSLRLIGEPMCKFLTSSVIASMQTGHTKPGIIISNDKVKRILEL